MSNPIIENAIFESKLIDLFSKIDISEVETDYPDEDIEKLKKHYLKNGGITRK